jgi:hypothetical protein
MQNKDKKDTKEELADNIMDLTFCFETLTIVEEAISKLNYIGNFTYSNSQNVMSNSIGQQIENKMKVQRDLEKKFGDLIIEKSGKTELLEENNINNLISQIQNCAEELKKSTNDICKSLSENPDIPKNLLKAKEDKNIILIILQEIKEDLILGKTDRFDSTVDNIVRNSIKIEEKRSDEMRLFKQLRNLNEELTKEESELQKETKNLENRLQAEKKKLAKTKMEENIFKGYRKNQLEALKNLKKTNFEDYEIAVNKEIVDKIKEKVSRIFEIFLLNFFNFWSNFSLNFQMNFNLFINYFFRIRLLISITK